MITIIPAIDIIDGKCVRLSMGDFDTKKIYDVNPVEKAREYANAGFKRLHLVDLDGAKRKKLVNEAVLKGITSATDIEVDFGGGLYRSEDVEVIFAAGASQITAGSIGVRNPGMVSEWISEFGGSRIILGADVKEGRIAVHGWQELTELRIIKYVEGYHKQGIETVICTDIDRDGMYTGPSFGLYKSLRQEFPDLKIIASGGVSRLSDVEKLDEAGIYGVIIGKALLEHKITPEELEPWLC